jgi:hypothetical protein
VAVVELWGRNWSRAELLARVGRLEQLAGIQLLEGGDGPERGVRMLRVASGSGFDLEILVDRGFDIGRAWFGGRPLAWWSPVGLVGPWYHDASGLEWFRAFPGGLVSTCGLDHCQLGGEDDATIFGFPHRRTQTYGLHGRYTGIPARLAGYGTEWHGDEAVLWAEGEVLQAAVFAEQLHLHRRIEVPLGGHAVRVIDRVTNVGATDCPHMLLYHCNVGFPVVDDGAELVYPSGPGTCVSDAGTPDYPRLTGPRPDYAEQCYEHDMAADDQGWVSAAVLNRPLGLGVYQRYRKDALPHHVTWRQLGQGTYVVAMEPSTNRDAGRFDARARGELLHLSAGEHRDYELQVGVLAGADAISGFAERAGGLAGASR